MQTISLDIRRMQIKITMCYQSTPVRMDKTNTKCWQPELPYIVAQDTKSTATLENSLAIS